MLGIHQRTSRRVAARSPQSGMTLVEVMIAAGIVAVAFLLAMESFVSISLASDISEDQAVAVATVSSLLEELRSLSFDELMAYQPPASESLGATTVIGVVCYDAAGAAHTLPLDPATLATPLPNPLEVEVTVVWRDTKWHPFAMRAAAFYGR